MSSDNEFLEEMAQAAEKYAAHLRAEKQRANTPQKERTIKTATEFALYIKNQLEEKPVDTLLDGVHIDTNGI